MGNGSGFRFYFFLIGIALHEIFLFVYISVPDVALDREVEGGLLLGDMGQGVPFRPGTFDGCIR